MRLIWMCCLLLTAGSACAPTTGCWFGVDAYEPLPLPTRYGARHHLPVPVLDDAKVIALHKEAWSLYFRHLRWPRQGTGFPRDYIDEAFNPHLFQWDTVFMMFFGRYGHRAFPAIVSLDNFYAKQHPDGYICRELDERTGEDFVYEGLEHTVNPPLFAWAEWETYRLTGDASRLERVLPPLVEYYEWIRRHRRTPDGLYWNTGLGSGMDNTPRAGEAWVCMTAQQALAARCIADMAEAVGRPELAARFRAGFDTLRRLINEKLWDEQDRFYHDRKDGAFHRVKTVAGFWPLLAGVVPPDRARELVRHLENEATFCRPHRVPTLAADHPDYQARGDYWRGSVWAPTNYMVVSGLAAAGYPALARTIAENHLKNMVAVHEETKTIWENYAPESAAAGDPARRDFVGWSGLGPTAMLYEHVLGFAADGRDHTLTWRLHRTDRHGLKQLGFGRVTVDVVARARESAKAPPVIDVTTDGRFTLIVLTDDGRRARRTFEAGSHEWEVRFEP